MKQEVCYVCSCSDDEQGQVIDGKFLCRHHHGYTPGVSPYGGEATRMLKRAWEDQARKEHDEEIRRRKD